MCTPILVIVGPTAVGKTELAVQVAKEVDGEIISADSMQVYRGLDIGTAKPTESERQGVPHHLLDIVDPGEGVQCGGLPSNGGGSPCRPGQT